MSEPDKPPRPNFIEPEAYAALKEKWGIDPAESIVRHVLCGEPFVIPFGDIVTPNTDTTCKRGLGDFL